MLTKVFRASQLSGFFITEADWLSWVSGEYLQGEDDILLLKVELLLIPRKARVEDFVEGAPDGFFSLHFLDVVELAELGVDEDDGEEQLSVD